MSRLDRRQWLRAAAGLALVPAVLDGTPVRAQTPAWRARKKRVAILGRQMAYYEVGEGNPRSHSDWLAAEKRIPKLFVHALPGALLDSGAALEFVRDIYRSLSTSFSDQS